MTNKKIQKSFIVEHDQSIAIDCLVKNCPSISKQKLKQAMKFGAVWLTHNGKTSRVRRAKKELTQGDELHLYYDEEILFASHQGAQLISDEKDYSIWNKPCGMFSQGTKWGDHTSICRWVELYAFSERPSFLVHRLDRAANGLILLAHSKSVASQFALLFENRKIEKQYQAIVMGEFPGTNKINRIERDIDGKASSTLILQSHYNAKKNQSNLLVQIQTGRKHQIRKHLSEIGYPIIGDRLYANENTNDKINLQLTSCYLAFECPLTQNKKSYTL